MSHIMNIVSVDFTMQRGFFLFLCQNDLYLSNFAVSIYKSICIK